MDFLRKQNICIESKTDVLKEGTYTEYGISNKTLEKDKWDTFKNSFRDQMANALSDIILNDVTECFVYEILRKQYCCFNPNEKQSIFNHLKKGFEKDNQEDLNKIMNTKMMIVKHLNDYLKENSFIHLEGFVRFYLKDYVMELENRTEQAIEDFFMEKEYNEFINLLRYFVELQEPKIETIHLFMSEDEDYLLYDQKGCIINDDYLESLSAGIHEKDMNADDVLISSLITLAPINLIIHFSSKMENKEIIETIKKIFSDKISICNEDTTCLPAKNFKQE